MGAGEAASAGAEPAAARPPRDREPARAAPPPTSARAHPWHPFPLVELCVFIGLVLLVWGLFTADEARGPRAARDCGMALGSLGGLDTALREHFSGYRSHALLIAARAGVFVGRRRCSSRARPWVDPGRGGRRARGGFVLLRRAFRARH
jgi:hypothetical protein